MLGRQLRRPSQRLVVSQSRRAVLASTPLPVPAVRWDGAATASPARHFAARSAPAAQQPAPAAQDDIAAALNPDAGDAGAAYLDVEEAAGGAAPGVAAGGSSTGKPFNKSHGNKKHGSARSRNYSGVRSITRLERFEFVFQKSGRTLLAPSVYEPVAVLFDLLVGQGVTNPRDIAVHPLFQALLVEVERAVDPAYFGRRTKTSEGGAEAVTSAAATAPALGGEAAEAGGAFSTGNEEFEFGEPEEGAAASAPPRPRWRPRFTPAEVTKLAGFLVRHGLHVPPPASALSPETKQAADTGRLMLLLADRLVPVLHKALVVDVARACFAFGKSGVLARHPGLLAGLAARIPSQLPFVTEHRWVADYAHFMVAAGHRDPSFYASLARSFVGMNKKGLRPPVVTQFLWALAAAGMKADRVIAATRTGHSLGGAAVEDGLAALAVRQLRHADPATFAIMVRSLAALGISLRDSKEALETVDRVATAGKPATQSRYTAGIDARSAVGFEADTGEADALAGATRVSVRGLALREIETGAAGSMSRDAAVAAIRGGADPLWVAIEAYSTKVLPRMSPRALALLLNAFARASVTNEVEQQASVQSVASAAAAFQRDAAAFERLVEREMPRGSGIGGPEDDADAELDADEHLRHAESSGAGARSSAGGELCARVGSPALWQGLRTVAAASLPGTNMLTLSHILWGLSRVGQANDPRLLDATVEALGTAAATAPGSAKDTANALARVWTCVYLLRQHQQQLAAAGAGAGAAGGAGAGAPAAAATAMPPALWDVLAEAGASLAQSTFDAAAAATEASASPASPSAAAASASLPRVADVARVLGRTVRAAGLLVASVDPPVATAPEPASLLVMQGPAAWHPALVRSSYQLALSLALLITSPAGEAGLDRLRLAEAGRLMALYAVLLEQWAGIRGVVTGEAAAAAPTGGETDQDLIVRAATRLSSLVAARGVSNHEEFLRGHLLSVVARATADQA